MADNKIVAQFILQEDGTLKRVSGDISRLAAETDRLANSNAKFNEQQARTYKGMQGIAGNSSNVTKEFSKQNQILGMEGFGLVGAYAVLASNLFAAQAAFLALQRASELTTLQNSLDYMGSIAGRNLSALASEVVELTGNTLALGDAMRTTSVATTSGFSSSQLKQLTTVALGASTALGRNMTDSMDRLVKGTAKMEAEILDELGLLVKVEEASKKYADAMGIAGRELTQFEKVQAFTNEAIAQGLDKYGKVAEKIDPEPYAKLAASILEAGTAVGTFINETLRFGDAANYLSENIGALAVILSTLGLGLAKQIAPAMFKASASIEAYKEGLVESKARTLEMVGALGELTPTAKTAMEELISGGDAATAQAAALNSLNDSLDYYTKKQKEFPEGSEKYAYYTAKIKERDEQIKRVTEGVQNYTQAQKQFEAQMSRTAAIENASMGTLRGLRASIEDVKDSYKSYSASARTSGKANSLLASSLVTVKSAAFAAGTAVRAAGAAFATFLPYIGMIITAVTVAYGAIKDKFFPEDLVQKRIDEAVEKLDYFSDVLKNTNDLIKDGNYSTADSYDTLAGVIDTFSEAAISAVSSARSSILKDMGETQKALAATFKEMEKPPSVIDWKAYLPWTDSTADMSKKLKEQKDALARADKEILLATSKSFIEQAKAMKEAAPGNTVFDSAAMDGYVSSLKDLNAKLTKGEITVAKYQASLRMLNSDIAAISATNKGVSDSVASFNQAVLDSQKKIRAPFQDFTEGLQEVFLNLDLLEERYKKAFDAAKANPSLENTKALEEANALLDEQKAKLEGLKIPTRFLVEAAQNRELATKNYLAYLERTQDSYRGLYTTSLSHQNTLSLITSTQVKEGGIAVAIAEQQNAAEEAKLKLLQNQLNTEISTTAESEKDAQYNAKIFKLKSDIRATQLSILSAAELTAIESKAAAEQDQKSLAVSKEKAKILAIQNAQLIASRAATGLDTELEQAREQIRLKKEYLTTLQKEAKIELDLLKASRDRELGQLDSAMKTADSAELERLKAIKAEKEAAYEVSIANLINQQGAQQKVAKAEQDSLEAALKVTEVIKEQDKYLESQLAHREHAVSLAKAQISSAAALRDLEIQMASLTNAPNAKALAYEAAIQNALDTIEAEKLSNELALNRLEIERQITAAKFEATGGVIDDKEQAILDRLDKQIAKTKELNALNAGTAMTGVTSAALSNVAGASSSPNSAMNALPDSFTQSQERIDAAIATEQAIATARIKVQEEYNRLSHSLVNAKTSGEKDAILASMQSLVAQQDTLTEAAALATQERTLATMGAISNMTGAMGETFKEFGPEGAVIGTLLEGISTSTEAISSAFALMESNSASSTQKTIGALQAVGSVISSIGAISAAASDQRISALDREIDAEKARDGQSAQSLAKIAALEKKKEAEKKKAFEMDKKMKMAQTVIATATGMMQAVAQGGIFGIPIAAMIGVMGAAQLAMISSTSYQGTAASVADSGPTTVSMGSRDSAVDVASSTSAANELAYLRGDDGIGSAENFRPAFTGARHRATGGATTGFIVGEQGPELFVPEQPGTIVPNGDMQQGSSVNANINISAIDATGVEELLTAQRGNIIAMLREAANSNGETFLESVNTSEYSRSSTGINRY